MARGGTSGATGLRQVREGVARGWPSGVTLLAGEDAYHRDAAQAALLEALVPKGSEEFGLTVFGNEKTPGATIVAAARSVGMFSPRRVVWVRDIEAIDGGPEPFEAFAAAPPAESYLVVRAPKLDLRKKLPKALAKLATVVRFDRGGDREWQEAVAETKRLAKERGLAIDRDGLTFLLESAQLDLYAVRSELDKLRDWSGAAGAKIDLEILRSLVRAGGSMTGWEISEAIQARRTADGVAAARRLVDDGEEPIRLLGGIAWTARTLLQAKAMEAAGVPPRSIAARLRARRELLDGMRAYRLDELLRFPHHLADADCALKSRGVPPGAVLERLVIRLTGRQETAP